MDLNDLTNENYNKYVQSKAKPSPIGKNLVWAFTVGGLICVLGQGMWDGYHALGLDEKTARTAVSITLIFITALLTGIGVFDSFAKHAGAGTLVPITGFANAVVAPAMEFRQEGFVTGTAVKLFTGAGVWHFGQCDLWAGVLGLDADLVGGCEWAAGVCGPYEGNGQRIYIIRCPALGGRRSRRRRICRSFCAGGHIR